MIIFNRLSVVKNCLRLETIVSEPYPCSRKKSPPEVFGKFIFTQRGPNVFERELIEIRDSVYSVYLDSMFTIR